MPLVPAEVMLRIWIGNRVTVPAHIDEAHSIACAVSGRRCFMLFPPDQVGNLYIGPLDHAPTGAPISMVDVDMPNLQRFPNFTQALAAAEMAELSLGDAIYIPTLWWHHVVSLQKLNILVNYWWGGSIGNADTAQSPMQAMRHALLALQDATPTVREAWRVLFGHFVFQQNDADTGHIPSAWQGVLGPLDAPARVAVRRSLALKLMA